MIILSERTERTVRDPVLAAAAAFVAAAAVSETEYTPEDLHRMVGGQITTVTEDFHGDAHEGVEERVLARVRTLHDLPEEKRAAEKADIKKILPHLHQRVAQLAATKKTLEDDSAKKDKESIPVLARAEERVRSLISTVEAL
jgi:hypothetical protein